MDIFNYQIVFGSIAAIHKGWFCSQLHFHPVLFLRFSYSKGGLAKIYPKYGNSDF